MADDTSLQDTSNTLDSLTTKTQALTISAGGFARAMTQAFSASIAGGKQLDDVLKNLALRVSSLAVTAAFKPVASGLTSGIASLFSGVTGAGSAAAATVQANARGAIKPFAVGSGKPPNILPNVPSVQDVGLPQMDNVFWQALYAPAGTPEPIIRKLNAALREALASPEVQKAYADTGASTYPVEQQTPEFASAVLKQEVERITAVIRENNIKVGQ